MKDTNDARLAALEELSALDQELELKYGIVGNPMIKAQERTPPDVGMMAVLLAGQALIYWVVTRTL